MPRYWMITNRNIGGTGDTLGKKLAGRTHWVTDEDDLTKLPNWKRVSVAHFSTLLRAAADEFPLIDDPNEQENQKHVTVFVHGYNNSWDGAATRYQSICNRLYSGPDSLGLCLFYTWPSNGSVEAYLPDRADARESGMHLGEVLSTIYDWMLRKQLDASEDPAQACKAKLSVIAHSMGNYVLQKAMQIVWTRKNRPLLVSLVNQLLMVAADVDNDLFRSGEKNDDRDGDAIANLCYRVTALYTGLDPVLGISAGLKHYGKRRLGRSGLDKKFDVPDNVWDVDCTQFFDRGEKNIHSAYFDDADSVRLMRRILQGTDRRVLQLEGTAPREQAMPVTNVRPATPAVS